MGAGAAYDARVTAASWPQMAPAAPSDLPPPLAPPARILLGPGPSEVPASVLAALAAPTVGHLDPYYLTLMDQTRVLLQRVFRTNNPLTLAISGTGSAGME